MSAEQKEEVRIPVVEERLDVRKETVETGKVRLKSRVEEEEKRVSEVLRHERVRVERVPAERISEDAPEMREEADRLIVPVFEEVIVKRYRVTEEVHLIRERSEEPFEENVTLRRNRVEVERD